MAAVAIGALAILFVASSTAKSGRDVKADNNQIRKLETRENGEHFVPLSEDLQNPGLPFSDANPAICRMKNEAQVGSWPVDNQKDPNKITLKCFCEKGYARSKNSVKNGLGCDMCANGYQMVPEYDSNGSVNYKCVDKSEPCPGGFTRSYTGKCDQCDSGFIQQSDPLTGDLMCVSDTNDGSELRGADPTRVLTADIGHLRYKERNYDFQNTPLFDDGSKLRSAAQFENEGEEVPGMYPSFGSYKQVPFISLEDYNKASLAAAENFNFIGPNSDDKVANDTGIRNRMGNDPGSTIIKYPYENIKQRVPDLEQPLSENSNFYPSRSYKQVESVARRFIGSGDTFSFKKSVDRTQLSDAPVPRQLDNSLVNVSDRAADYAIGSFGIGYNNPLNQMTNWANGDIMTGYKPINEIMRPIAEPILTQRLEERKVSYDPTPSVEPGLLAGPNNVDEYNLKRKQAGDTPDRTPYPVTGSYIPTKIQGKLAERQQKDEINFFKSGNPFYQITGDYNSRRETEFRQKGEVYRPEMVGLPFYGEYLNPVEDTAIRDKNFFVGTENLANTRDDRDVDRILVAPRSDSLNVDMQMIRSIPNRMTSVKTNQAHYADAPIYSEFPKRQPTRSAAVSSDTLKTQSAPLTPYTTPWYPSMKYEPRSDMAVGLPVL